MRLLIRIICFLSTPRILGQATQTTLPETGEQRVLHNHFFSGKHLGMLWTIDVDDLLHKLICKEGYRATKYSILRNVWKVPNQLASSPPRQMWEKCEWPEAIRIICHRSTLVEHW